ncbi:MAG: BMP family ABC transporter substrate-binding protein [Actinomycetales bacterium]|nr:BMP family ABC transporter substrate-binding protein [Actinomycetales bacterium]
MLKLKRTQIIAAVMLSMGLILSACGGSGDSGSDKQKIAAIFSGPTTDADYNGLGLLALQDLEKNGAEIAYSESVPVPDIERVLREYVADGYNIIWTHGSQFYEATAKVAKENPDVNFVGEFDGEPEGQPDNVWVIDRNFHTVFYPIGTLAANLTKTGKVGYLGGLSLPFSFSEVHSVRQALADSGKGTALQAVWTGDFNDTVKAQQLATELLNKDNDVIITSLNLGVIGAFKAVTKKPAGEAWLTVKYTDKSKNGKGHYAGTALYDFVGPMNEIVDKIADGESKGYFVITFGSGASVEVGDDVPAEVKDAVQASVDGILDGSIKVKLDQSETK